VNEFYYQSADIRINDNINEHIKCIEIMEHLGLETLTGILVQKVNIDIYINKNSMNIRNNKKNRNN
jgi:hypothetical protein